MALTSDRLRVLLLRLLVGLVVSGPSLAVPVTIDYELTALAAVNRYEYRYTVTNLSLAVPVGWFSTDFDTALYDEASLLITSPGLSDWSEQILASVLGTPAQYDAYKTIGAALGIGDSETGFTVQFTWLGAATPGSQAFTVYDPSTLGVLDTGRTTVLAGPLPPPPPSNSVPEPSTAALTLLALYGVFAAKRHVHSSVNADPT